MKRPIAASLIFATALVAVWQAVLVMGIVSPAALARPLEVLMALPRLFGPDTADLTTTGNAVDVASTAWRSMLAFLISVPFGVGVALAIAASGSYGAPARFTVDFLRSIPSTALVPVFIILIGLDDSTKVVVGAFSSALVICLSTISGLRNRSATRVGMSRIFGMKGWRRVVLLDLPEAAPQVFLGLRTGLSLALVLVVVSEMLIGSSRGLGKVIYDMRATDDMGRMYAALIVAGVIGYLYNLSLAFAERKLLHWRGHH